MMMTTTTTTDDGDDGTKTMKGLARSTHIYLHLGGV